MDNGLKAVLDMRVEKVIVNAAFVLVCAVRCRVLKSVFDDSVRMIAVESACPQIYFPTHRPAGSFVSAQLQGVNGGLEYSLLGEIWSSGCRHIKCDMWRWALSPLTV